MPYNADAMKQHFSVPQGSDFSGEFGYDPEKKFNDRWRHDPWTWWHLVETKKHPHITAWGNDFSGKPSQLNKFHITFYHKGSDHMPVHVYYEIKGNQVRRTGLDANRCGGNSDAGRQEYFDNKSKYDKLAQHFIEGVFGTTT